MIKSSSALTVFGRRGGARVGSPEIDWYHAQQELLYDRENTLKQDDRLK